MICASVSISRVRSCVDRHLTGHVDQRVEQLRRHANLLLLLDWRAARSGLRRGLRGSLFGALGRLCFAPGLWRWRCQWQLDLR
jgi:hypothetical protein